MKPIANLLRDRRKHLLNQVICIGRLQLLVHFPIPVRAFVAPAQFFGSQFRRDLDAFIFHLVGQPEPGSDLLIVVTSDPRVSLPRLIGLEPNLDRAADHGFAFGVDPETVTPLFIFADRSCLDDDHLTAIPFRSLGDAAAACADDFRHRLVLVMRCEFTRIDPMPGEDVGDTGSREIAFVPLEPARLAVLEDGYSTTAIQPHRLAIGLNVDLLPFGLVSHSTVTVQSHAGHQRHLDRLIERKRKKLSLDVVGRHLVVLSDRYKHPSSDAARWWSLS